MDHIGTLRAIESMDLPTCPACKQSVLDDDAVECPFCGAPMKGGQAAARPSVAPKLPSHKSSPVISSPGQPAAPRGTATPPGPGGAALVKSPPPAPPTPTPRPPP